MERYFQSKTFGARSDGVYKGWSVERWERYGIGWSAGAMDQIVWSAGALLEKGQERWSADTPGPPPITGTEYE